MDKNNLNNNSDVNLNLKTNLFTKNLFTKLFLFIFIFILLFAFIFNIFKSNASSLLQENKVSYAIINTFYEIHSDIKNISSEIEVFSLLKDIPKNQYNIYSAKSYLTPEFNIVTDIPNKQILIDSDFAKISISSKSIVISELLSKSYGFSTDTITQDLQIELDTLDNNHQTDLFSFFSSNLDILQDISSVFLKNIPAILNCFDYIEDLPTRVTLTNGTHDVATYLISPDYDKLQELLINITNDIFNTKSIKSSFASNILVTNSVLDFFKNISGFNLFSKIDILENFKSLDNIYNNNADLLVLLQQDAENYINKKIWELKTQNNKYYISLFNQKVVQISTTTKDNKNILVNFNNLDNLLEQMTFTINDYNSNSYEIFNFNLTLEDNILYFNLLDELILEYKMLETKNNLIINYKDIYIPLSANINSKENIILSLGGQECIIKKSSLDKSWFKEEEYINIFGLSNFEIYMLFFELLLSF